MQAVCTFYRLQGHSHRPYPAKTLTLGVCWPNVIVYIGNWLDVKHWPRTEMKHGPTLDQCGWPSVMK